MDFQINLACLCLEVSIFFSRETKTKILAFFFFFLDQSCYPESWHYMDAQITL